MHYSVGLSLIHLMQLSDSALPVGGFTFSNTVESAIAEGVIHDKESLRDYCLSLTHSCATTDAVAAINAYHSTLATDYASVEHIDSQLTARKAGSEQRLMSSRMGRKLAQLGEQLLQQPLPVDFLCEQRSANYAVVMGVIFARCGLGTRQLFCTLTYNTLCTALQASLRCMRITHITTQQILFELATIIEPLYDEVAKLHISQMHSFSPQADIMAWRHEQSRQRLFMN